MKRIVSLKKEYEYIDKVIDKRLHNLLPKIMKEAKIDTWIVIAREYNEDPVLKHVVYSSFPTARRLTILVFHLEKGKLDFYNLGRPDPSLNLIYTQAWDVKTSTTQYEALNNLLSSISPTTIALDYSKNYAVADGLSHQLYENLINNLNSEFTSKIVSAEYLIIRFLETRIPLEHKIYKTIGEVAKNVIESAFSRKVITPGVTKCSDVEWYMKELTHKLGLPFWFPPTIDLQRVGIGIVDGDPIIEKGDLLHCDYGLVYYNLATDTQRLCYVLNDDETEVPADLLSGMKDNDKFQDIVVSNFVYKASGNQILAKSLSEGKEAGLKPILYSHPIGYFGHGPGPTIGLYNDQTYIKGSGEWLLNYDTYYALELTTITYVPSFKTDIRFMTEESIGYTSDKTFYLFEDRKQIYKI